MGVRLLAHHRPILPERSTSQFDGSVRHQFGHAGTMRRTNLCFAVVMGAILVTGGVILTQL